MDLNLKVNYGNYTDCKGENNEFYISTQINLKFIKSFSVPACSGEIHIRLSDSFQSVSMRADAKTALFLFFWLLIRLLVSVSTRQKELVFSHYC